MRIDVFQIDELVIVTNINWLDYRPINENGCMAHAPCGFPFPRIYTYIYIYIVNFFKKLRKSLYMVLHIEIEKIER